ncbi:MAG: hypothetical protein HZA11_13395 [Nitrospirae bacterium]|nr:hypothetical protein [Nitrospirota bacterium]
MAEEPKYNPETVKAILNVLQREYEAEEGRMRFITSKVQMMLTLAGILLTAIAFLFNAVIDHNWLTNLNRLLLFFAASFIVIAFVLLLHVMRIREFKRIKYEALVSNSELKKESVEVESRLISTYEDALKDNVPVVDRMAKVFQRGTVSIRIAIVLIYIVLLIILNINLKTFIGGIS